MAKEMFYYKTIKNYIVAFSSIFDNIKIINDNNAIIKIPIHYSPKEKYIPILAERGNYEVGTNYYTTLPRMGFEVMGIEYAPDRMSNPLSKIPSDLGDGYIYTRLPYDINFNLYVATKKQEEGLMIIEQILPIFIPELNITINDLEGYNFKTDVPVILQSTDCEVEYEGDYNTRRSMWLWTLSFRVKGWLYGSENKRQLIKKTIIDFSQMDINKRYELLMSEIQPFDAKKSGDYIIKDTIITPDN